MARGQRKRQTRRRSPAQKGGARMFLTEALTPGIRDEATMREQMNFFYIQCHGNTVLERYFVVPPGVFLLLTGEAGFRFFSHWRGTQTWTDPTAEDWDMIHKMLYGVEGEGYSLKEEIALFRGLEDRKLYLPGDILPDNICDFTSSDFSAPLGVFQVPITNPFLLSLQGTPENPERFNQVWSILFLQKSGVLPREALEAAEFHSEAVKREWESLAAQANPIPPRDIPLSHFFKNPRRLVDIYDSLIMTNPALNLVPRDKLSADKKIYLSELLQIRGAPEKPFRFFVATMCRTAYSFDRYEDPRAYAGRPNVRMMRRLSLAASEEQCASAGSAVLTLAPALDIWRRIQGNAEELARFDATHSSLPVIFDHITAGNPIPVGMFSALLELAATPVQEDLPPDSPARMLEQAVVDAFHSVRRNIRQILRSQAPTTGQRLRNYVMFQPSGEPHRSDLFNAAAHVEQRENMRNNAAKLDRLIEFNHTLEGILAEAPELVRRSLTSLTKAETDAIRDTLHRFQQEFQNIYTITYDMGVEYYERIREKIDAVHALLYDLETLSGYQRNFYIRKELKPALRAMERFANTIPPLTARIRGLSEREQEEEYERLLGPIRAENQRRVAFVEENPGDRAGEILLEDFRSIVGSAARNAYEGYELLQIQKRIAALDTEVKRLTAAFRTALTAGTASAPGMAQLRQEVEALNGEIYRTIKLLEISYYISEESRRVLQSRLTSFIVALLELRTSGGKRRGLVTRRRKNSRTRASPFLCSSSCGRTRAKHLSPFLCSSIRRRTRAKN